MGAVAETVTSNGGVPEDLWVWGADVSTRCLAVGFAGPGLAVESVQFEKGLVTGARLDDIYARAFLFAVERRDKFPPYYCFVEQPAAFGRPPEPALMYAVGCVQAGLFAGLRGAHRFPTEVRTIAISSWKARSVGNGRATKDDVMRWALARGVDGVWTQDEADALGVAVGGRVLLEPEPEQLAL